MTRVDFYLLGSTGDRRELIACRLVEKAYRLGHKVYLLAPDPAAARTLDDLLWTYSQGSFVPHALYGGEAVPDEPPVLVGSDEPPATCTDVLVSLADPAPAWFMRFARVAELVGADDPDRQRGRERFRYYREQGCVPETHNL